MKRLLKIAIVGYGIAGIASAILLRRLGHDVLHFEREASPAPAGAGLLLNHTGLVALDHLGVLDEARARGARVSRVFGDTIHGTRVMDLRYADHSIGHDGLGIQRGALHDVLRSADGHAGRVQTSCDIVAVDAARGYLFDKARGRLGPFDLIVAADGVASGVRRGVPSLVRRDRRYPWAAVVCLLADPRGLAGDRVWQRFDGVRHVSVWPVGCIDAGSPRCLNVSLNVAVEQLESWLDPARWKQRVQSLLPELRPLLDETGPPRLLSYTYRDIELRKLFERRVVLVGDAAHSMSPQLGQGASMALMDARALSESLDAAPDVAIGLDRFDGCRRPDVTRLQRISRCVTPFFQSDSRTLAALRDRSFYPLSRLPFLRKLMLATLAGGQAELADQAPH